MHFATIPTVKYLDCPAGDRGQNVNIGAARFFVNTPIWLQATNQATDDYDDDFGSV